MIATIPHDAELHCWARPMIDTTLKRSISKKTDTDANMQAFTLEHIDTHYKTHKKIYTDGSRKMGQVGIGIWSADCNIDECGKTTDHAAIATAELSAIKTTLDILATREDQNEEQIVILTDSLSALNAMERMSTKNKRFDILNKIIRLNHILKEKNKEITYCWIPSHTGVYGNDQADMNAKKGANLSHITHNIKLGSNEIKSLITKRTKAIKWDKLWKSKKKLTREIMPTVIKGKTPYGTPKLERITKLRLGNPIFISQQKNGKDKKCAICDVEKDIEHVLLSCPKHKERRDILQNHYDKSGLPLTIYNILAPKNNKKVINANIKFINSLKELI